MIENHWHCITCRGVCAVGVQLCQECQEKWPCSVCGKPSAFSNGETMLCANHRATKPITEQAALESASAKEPQ